MMDNYLIVYRIGARFIQVETPREGRGLLPDEAWVFGRPITRGEDDLFHAVEPVLQIMKPENVHRVHTATGFRADIFLTEVARR